MACGLQDDLLPTNRWFYQAAIAAGLDISYVEAEGGHEWLFWGEHLNRWLQVVGESS
jgi:enterochelin esterase-like enzyme